MSGRPPRAVGTFGTPGPTERTRSRSRAGDTGIRWCRTRQLHSEDLRLLPESRRCLTDRPVGQSISRQQYRETRMSKSSDSPGEKMVNSGIGLVYCGIFVGPGRRPQRGPSPSDVHPWLARRQQRMGSNSRDDRIPNPGHLRLPDIRLSDSQHRMGRIPEDRRMPDSVHHLRRNEAPRESRQGKGFRCLPQKDHPRRAQPRLTKKVTKGFKRTYVKWEALPFTSTPSSRSEPLTPDHNYLCTPDMHSVWGHQTSATDRPTRHARRS